MSYLSFDDVSNAETLDAISQNRSRNSSFKKGFGLKSVSKNKIKPGYIYVLVHPSIPDLFKIGQTTRHPEERLAEHNSNYNEYTGQIVKKTGRKWELKEYYAVPDPSWAETVFWNATGLSDIPFRQGIEIEKMSWKLVQQGLEAAKKAGIRPQQKLFPDHVYAYTVWMKKRLKGRGITLVGLVTSRSGKATFRCSNGHEWRTRSTYVGEGEGCPLCGIGYRETEEIWREAKLGYLCLLIHPKKPGVIKIGLTYKTLEQCYEDNLWGDWQIHRYRFVEDPVLAERLIWGLLGLSHPPKDGIVKMDLSLAEQAFRSLIAQMHHEIALTEKEKINCGNP